ncbi:TRAP transporter large permease [Piscinibacter gummiphilus]|uniref:TRAP transporter large permease protein n=1 Tax=Piscinibacter gummiphilus TaxID=946333 RepID=A0A1W6LB67_9BURK|nr:TRAP transporter large permease [Piscinibacter gummiphilus]ARN21482.1 C4-dicarboxylate ABC transporter permease [Piscinibacter gummiphilus]ATU66165.1 TRAP transporter large permease [Piscinibacter gummiphilus]GLS96157.1 C4-dicarboxylate ABC transporter permease [Piscinibacter gummiphilus]
MTGTTIGLLMFGGMLLMMALRVPITAAMFVPGAIGYWAMTNDLALLNSLKGSAVARLTVYDLSVIPLFLLMGQFATQGGLSRDLFRAAAAFVGHVRGGLAMAAILSAAAFGAVCGSSVATSATITQVAYPEMRAHGYHGRLSTAALATGGTLGILIPPSVPLVVYAILTEQNIAKLFAAALVPGIIATLGYVIVVAITCKLRPQLATPSAPLPWSARWRALVGVWPIAAIFVVVFGGIYGGWFSPTEGAAVGALGTFVAGAVRGELKLDGLKRSFLGTAETTAMVFMIFIGADMMNAALALTQMPTALADWVGHLQVGPLWIVVAVLVSYVVLGCVMDELSMLLLTIPVIFPTIMALDLWGLTPEHKAIWFGILVLMTVGIGLIAPPVGLNVYVVNSLAKDVSMNETYKGVFPFLASDVLRVIALLFFPVLSLGLVRAFF